MKRNTTFVLLLLMFSLFLNLSCTLTKECKDALADLTTDVAIAGATTILTGIPFNVPNVIKNIIDVTKECLTLAAGESESRLKIDYDLNSNSSYSENKLNNNFAVPSINAGEQANENYTFSFNSPGQYRLITFADDTEVVTERDENNNASAPDIASAGRMAEPVKQVLIITVLPNPGYVKPVGAPDVELISRIVTVTPQ